MLYSGHQNLAHRKVGANLSSSSRNLAGRTVTEWIDCKCYYCISDRPHGHGPDLGAEFFSVSSVTTKAESLDPADRIQVEACALCGHKREVA